LAWITAVDALLSKCVNTTVAWRSL